MSRKGRDKPTAVRRGDMTYAGLTQEHPRFVEVTLEQVKHLNRDVARLIR